MSVTPIKAALQTLNQHADVVAAALTGVVDIGEEFSRKQIMELRQAGALRASGEDGYRLHPRLREYLQDHLQLFPSFQSLTDIGAKINLLGSLWDEIASLRGDRESAAGMTQEFYSTAMDIEDAMGRNTIQLHILMSTRYGAVKSLAAKRSQNNFYQKQTTQLNGDLGRLASTCKKIEDETSARGRDDLVRVIRSHLMRNLSGWQHSLSEMQTFLRSEIYRIRIIEHHMKLLARADMLLRQQPGWRGFEADLPEKLPDFLIAAKLAPIIAHCEPMEADSVMVSEMVSLAKVLPKMPSPKVSPTSPVRYTRIVDSVEEIIASADLLALQKLFRAVDSMAHNHVAATAERGLSLIGWRSGDDDAQKISPPVWLALSLSALRAAHYTVELTDNPPRAGERFSHTFRDARVFPKQVKGGFAGAST